MNFKKGLLVMLAGALLMPVAANAATINFADSSFNGNTVNDFSVEGLIDFDFLIDNSGMTVLVVDLSAAEMAAGSVDLRFAGLASFIGGIESLTLAVGSAGDIGFVGDAFDSDGNPITVVHTPSLARAEFAPPDTGVFTIGALGPGVVDWVLNFPTGASSIKLSLTVKEATVIPLPAGVWLLVSALGGLGLMRRRAS